MTFSPAACVVYTNGSATPGCATNPTLIHYFGQSSTVTYIFYLAVAIAIAGIAMYGQRVYWEYPWGRFFFHKRGVKAVMRFSGEPGMLGMLTEYIPNIFMFESSGRRKGRIRRLIPAVPGAITHLRQEDGGDSFTLIDGDIGMPVTPELEEWAQHNLSELASTRDWTRFALKTKYAMAVSVTKQAALFPVVKDWNPGEQNLLLVDDKGARYQKKAKDLAPQEKEWYINTSRGAEQVARDAENAKDKTEAILNGQDFYMDGPTRVDLEDRDKAEWVDEITKEIRDAKGDVGNALLRGKVISGQFVARVLSNTPNGLAWDKGKAKIAEMVKEELTGLQKFAYLVPMAIAGAIIIGALAFGYQIIAHG